MGIALDYEERPENRASKWLGQGFWALMDQGLFAGSSFALTILLGRWLDQMHYGAFGVAFAVFLLLATIHNGLLVEPMLVFGPDHYKDRVPQYLGALFIGNWLLSVLVGGVLAIMGGVCLIIARMNGPLAVDDGTASLATACLTFAFVGPCVLLLWLMRRACYVTFNPRRAALAGAGYCFAMLALLAWLEHSNRLTVVSALIVFGASSLVAALWIAWGEKIQFPRRADIEFCREIARDHWRYGKWAAPTGVVCFLPANVYALILPRIIDLAAVGALKAVANFVMPFVTANAALCVLLLPKFVKLRGSDEFDRTFRFAMALLVGVPALGWVALGLQHHFLVHLVYRGKFDEYGSLLWIIGLQPVLTGICGVYMAAIQAQQRPHHVFYASAVTGVVSLVGGILLMYFAGLTGAAISIVLSLAVNAALLAVLYRRESCLQPPEGLLAAVG